MIVFHPFIGVPEKRVFGKARLKKSRKASALSDLPPPLYIESMAGRTPLIGWLRIFQHLMA